MSTIELERPTKKKKKERKKKKENCAFYGNIENFSQIVSDLQKRGGDEAEQWTENTWERFFNIQMQKRFDIVGGILAEEVQILKKSLHNPIIHEHR